MDLDQALKIFIAECRELLEDMETSLLALEQTEEKGELINSIFRAAHTIKGSSGLFSLDHVVAFTHVVENVLDRVRAGKLAIGDELVAALLLCCDHMRSLVALQHLVKPTRRSCACRPPGSAARPSCGRSCRWR